MKVLVVLKQRWALPYRPGVYLFPAGVIDAIGGVDVPFLFPARDTHTGLYNT